MKKAFLKYLNYIHNDVDPKSGPAPKIQNKFIFEVGIDAFNQITGIFSHKSCKSGQDRTLTQIAFQLTLKKWGFKFPESRKDKADFAADFFVFASIQATPVIELARGKGAR